MKKAGEGERGLRGRVCAALLVGQPWQPPARTNTQDKQAGGKAAASSSTPTPVTYF